MEGVAGDLHISASRGETRLEESGGNVLAREDRLGDVRVRRVAGDLSILHDSGGDIEREAIGGALSIP